MALFFGSRSSAQEDFPKVVPARMRSEQIFGPFDYDLFLEREKNGEFPFQGGDVPGISPYDSLTNNNAGSTGTAFFTQSETTLVAFGSTIVVGFNDSGSNSGGSNKFTGFARSIDGGFSFTDGGTLPTNPNGDAGDPVMARDNNTGRIFFSTLQFTGPGINVFHSDDNGVTWSLPVNGTPGRPSGSQDKEWIAVDNFAGPGNGNVYLLTRDFGPGPGIYCFRSTDGGNTFGPSAGTLIVSGNQGAFVAVAPDHAVHVFWYAGTTLQTRKSTDQGLTFSPAVTVASGLVGGTNGDLGLTGTRQGTATPAGFRSSEFPHAAVNPVNGNVYVTFANNPAGTDKADVFFVQSTDGGASWSAPVRVNDDATTTDQWQPTIAVTPDGAVVGIFYYSRQEDPAGNNLFKYYGRNGDISGGTVTFTPSYAISDTASLPEFGRDAVVNSTYMGDYDQAVATSGAFHVTWSDSRSDLPGGAPRKDPNVFYKTINLTLHVTTTVPAVGSVISTQPTTFTVDVSEPVDPATLNASDFTVNGIPADSVSYTPGSTTMQFTFAASPVTAEGLQTMNVAAGAFTSAAAGDPVAAFVGTFRFDTVLLQVISTSPPFPGGVFNLPSPLTYDVNFNEPVDPASVQTSDLQLSGIAGSSVTGVSVLPGNITARFTLNVPTEGTLTVNILAGAITDAFGNPGAAFTANYVVDIGTVPYPTPLLAKNPVGSLVYDPSISGNIGFAGDIDSFTLNVDPGQTLTAVVTGSGGLQPSVSLSDPSNNIIGSATAAAANQNALLQTVPATAAGTYTFALSGASGTTGNYTLQVILNAAKEAEGTLAGGDNNTIATAENIDPSFITLQTSQASAQRGAVNGTTDSANYSAGAIPFAFEDISGTGTVIAGLTNQDDASVSVPIGFNFSFYGVNNANVFVSSNGLLTFATASTAFTNSNLTTTPTQAAIASFWDDLHTGGGQPGSNVFSQGSGAGPDQHLTIQWNQVRFFSGGTAGDTLTYQVQLFADGRIQFNYQDLVSGTAAGNNGASATVGIKDAGIQGPNRVLLAFNNGPNTFVGTGQSTLLSPPAPTPDLFSFTLNNGDVATLAVKSLGLVPASVDLLDSGGLVIATGISATNVDRVINNYAAAAGGTYYARVSSGASVPYNLVVTRNAAFDTEFNNTFGTAQPIDGNDGVLGGIISSGVYEAASVPFAFEDISGTGTVIAGLTNQDDASVSVPIGFNFSFYGFNNANVFVSSNGLLTFATASTLFTNTDLTTVPTQATIAPFWDDLHTGGGQPGSNVFSQVSGAGADQHLTIQWNQVRFFSGGTAGDTLTYQVQLFAGGRIQFNYQDLVSGTAAGNNGASATVGIKDAGIQGPNRVLLAFNNGPNAFVGTGQSTLFSLLPSDDWYSITLGLGQTSISLETSTPADGPGEFINNLNPHIELYNPGNVLIATGVALADGRNESVLATGLATGTYGVRVNSESLTSGEYFLSRRIVVSGGLGMGFWKSKNGQDIIKNSVGTGLRTFLIGFNPFKDLSPTATNNQIAAYVTNVVNNANSSGASMNAILKSQMLATALDVYFSDPALGGNSIGAPAPIGGIHIDLTKVCKMIGASMDTCSGVYQDVTAAFGGATCPTVLDMLNYAASQAAPASGANPLSIPWYGQVKATQEMAKNAFAAINRNVALVCGP
jgi:hypothetical protein